MTTPGTNVPDLTVSELAFSLKRTLEESFGRVRVRGELSKVKIHTSGHLYSDLKDAESVINLVCWRGTVARLAVKPEEGLEVICTGRITTYPARSNYQLVIEQMELAGQGALLKLLEDRRQRLLAEGLFADDRKKPLPYLPRVIGVVTSPTGAVIRDIIHRLDDRFPSHVLVWPVPVQGMGAAEKIAAAIRGFAALSPGGRIPRPDLLIVARGGGSLEDLMPFNEEIVVRAVADCTIPLISAVGHETDTTLIDYAADHRAPTPTAAAERAVPELLPLLAYAQELGQRLTLGLRRVTAERRQTLATLSARLGDPRRLIEIQVQKFDYLGAALARALEGQVQHKRHNLLQIGGRLPHPGQTILRAEETLKLHGRTLETAGTRRLADSRQRLERAMTLLEALSFKGVLRRGFAVVRDGQGLIISQSVQTAPGLGLEIEFSDGRVRTRVESEGKIP